MQIICTVNVRDLTFPFVHVAGWMATLLDRLAEQEQIKPIVIAQKSGDHVYGTVLDLKDRLGWSAMLIESFAGTRDESEVLGSYVLGCLSDNDVEDEELLRQIMLNVCDHHDTYVHVPDLSGGEHAGLRSLPY